MNQKPFVTDEVVVVFGNGEIVNDGEAIEGLTYSTAAQPPFCVSICSPATRLPASIQWAGSSALRRARNGWFGVACNAYFSPAMRNSTSLSRCCGATD